MWCHEHFNLDGPPDVVTFSKKMQLGGYYHMPDFKYVFVNVTTEFFRLMYYNLRCWDCSVMADLLLFLISFFNKTFTAELEVMLWNRSANHWTLHCFYFTVYVWWHWELPCFLCGNSQDSVLACRLAEVLYLSPPKLRCSSSIWCDISLICHSLSWHSLLSSPCIWWSNSQETKK